MYDLLIKNGRVVTSERIFRGSVLIDQGKIVACTGDPGSVEARKVIDASGKYIFPGMIDTHAHLNDPGYTWREDFEHGTAAAAIGGYTTIMDMPLQNEPALTNKTLFQTKEAIVSKKSLTDYCLYGGLIADNFGEVGQLWEAGVIGYKVFIGPVSPDYSSLNYGQAYEAMKIVKRLGGRIAFHCEDYSMIKWLEKRAQDRNENTWKGFLKSRPVAAEMVATTAIIELAKDTGCKVHICHVSSPEVAEKIKEVRQAGYDITAETCGHYLSMTEEDVLEKGALYKCAPPLRSREEVNRLWDYVADGTFSGIASDHSPCTYEEKYRMIGGRKIETPFDVWGGISSIQNVFQTVFYEGVIKRKLSPSVIARVMSENPAKAFGIYGKKGAVQPGFDADLLLVDPDKSWEITEESLAYVNKMSAFVGKKGIGKSVMTIIRGEVVAEHDTLLQSPGYGQLIRNHRKES